MGSGGAKTITRLIPGPNLCQDMERRRGIILGAGLIAGVLLMGAVISPLLDFPLSGESTDSSYTITVEQIPDRYQIENDSLVEYDELNAEQQRQFDNALEGKFESDSLALDPTKYVRYNGTVYEITVTGA